ncbi:MAG: hypothetical protein ACTSU5_18515 [Promethearchaeota archaeon]
MIAPSLNGLESVLAFVLNAAAAAGGRSLDLATTRYVTRGLKLETNPLARRVGFRGMVLLQVPVVLLGGLDTTLAFFILTWSLLTAAANLEGSWFVRDEGEEAYRERLERAAKSASWLRIVLGEMNLIVSLVASGVLVMVFTFLEQPVLVLFVALAMVCHGAVASFRSLSFVRYLRRLPEAGAEGGSDAGGADGLGGEQ